MIYFLAPADVLFCMDHYVRRNRLDDLVQSISYDQILDRGILPPGSYIFAALDQITPTEAKLIARAWDLLSKELPGASLMNDPRRVLLRYPLLKAAHAAGDCNFRVHRASRVPANLRLPAFVRCERDHTGNLTPLLHSRAQISIWTARLLAGGYRLRDLIVCEFEDTSEDGVFRKYSAQCIHGQIIPRSLVVNRDWLTKDDGRILNAQTTREDFEFSEQNPHESWLKAIFARAGIAYGRADYAVVDGKPLLWEINTNPTVGPGQHDDPLQPRPGRHVLRPAREIFRKRFLNALVAADYQGDRTGSIDLGVTGRERRALSRERTDAARIAAHRTFVSSLAGPPIRMLRHLEKATRAWISSGEPAVPGESEMESGD